MIVGAGLLPSHLPAAWLRAFEQPIVLVQPFTLNLPRYRPAEPDQRWCFTCGEQRAEADFWAGVKHVCRRCKNEAQRARARRVPTTPR